MPDYSVDQELVQFGEGSLTFLEPRFGNAFPLRHNRCMSKAGESKHPLIALDLFVRP